jgi:hypothetical protein
LLRQIRWTAKPAACDAIIIFNIDFVASGKALMPAPAVYHRRDRF